MSSFLGLSLSPLCSFEQALRTLEAYEGTVEDEPSNERYEQSELALYKVPGLFIAPTIPIPVNVYVLLYACFHPCTRPTNVIDAFDCVFFLACGSILIELSCVSSLLSFFFVSGLCRSE